MRSMLLVPLLFLGLATAGAQIMPGQQNPGNPGIPGEPGTPPTFPRQQIPPDQTIPQAQTPQAPASQQVPPEQSATPAATPLNVQGCVSGDTGNFSLTDANGNVYQLVGADRVLSRYVGKTVEVTGTTNAPASSAATAPTTPTQPEEEENEPAAQSQPQATQPGSASTSTDQHKLVVSSVKEVSNSCGGERPQ